MSKKALNFEVRRLCKSILACYIDMIGPIFKNDFMAFLNQPLKLIHAKVCYSYLNVQHKNPDLKFFTCFVDLQMTIHIQPT